jgi:hypothetical protein
MTFWGLARRSQMMPPGYGLNTLSYEQPLALPLAEREGFRRHELGRLLIRRLDKPEEYAPVLYEGDSPVSGLFGRHPDARTQR